MYVSIIALASGFIKRTLTLHLNLCKRTQPDNPSLRGRGGRGKEIHPLKVWGGNISLHMGEGP